ncbi:stage II sporulation protein M [Salinibacterium sp. PAMC 21357]|uniref:stage II sporulation protein M n=1 Tax=Salinibacterium sp. PAMC 21357 TaxID=1112215 RepID=UPI000289BC95|nr:stage II sporulation protein M [Salinibacterium sp. PAMC 21357]
MDLDSYSAAHREDWDRLAQLGTQHRLSGVEVDELIDLYQSGATNLSMMKTSSGQSVQADRLSLTLSRARLRFTGASVNFLSQLPQFFVVQLPAALYRVRWMSLVLTAATFFVGFLFAWWAISNPQVLASFGTPAEREALASDDFVGYYSEFSGGSFTSLVWTNNAWLATQCIAFGIVGVFVPYLLFNTAQQLGFTAAIMNEFDRLDVFFLYIAPHGQLELYAVFVAGATGMMIFWSWIAPGNKSRAQSLAQAGRALFTIVIGLILALLVSGIIEGYVTRQDWPWPIKIGIGTIALASFLAYQWILGGRSARAGNTGDLSEFDAGATHIVAN